MEHKDLSATHLLSQIML